MNHADSVDDAIAEIFSLSLAKRKDFNTIWIHPLVHSWSRERLDQITRRRKAFHAISLVAASVRVDYDSRKVENRVMERMFMPHIQKGFQHICRNGSIGDVEAGASRRSDVRILAGILNHHGEYTPAGELYQWILAGEEKSLGKDHPDTLSTVHCMVSNRITREKRCVFCY